MKKTAMNNLHIPLPHPLYRRLRSEADRSGRPATDVAREAINDWLTQRQRQTTYDAIRDYAMETAGTADDLDKGLEAAAVEHLTTADQRRRGRS